MAINFEPYVAPKSAFKPFNVPKLSKDKPLVVNDGLLYKCSGCGGPVPDGVWIFEKVTDGKVVGLRMQEGADGRVVHQCGEEVPE